MGVHSPPHPQFHLEARTPPHPQFHLETRTPGHDGDHPGSPPSPRQFVPCFSLELPECPAPAGVEHCGAEGRKPEILPLVAAFLCYPFGAWSVAGIQEIQSGLQSER